MHAPVVVGRGFSAILCLLTLAGATGRSSAATGSGVSQLIVVSARSYRTTVATLTVYDLHGGLAHVTFGPWPARLGYDGFARPGLKREGDGHTPSGTYGLAFMFGVEPNPGVLFPYRRIHHDDVWDDDPSSPRYNEWVDDRAANPGASPEPMYDTPAYDYGVVIDYNTARVPGRGSAVFLHVDVGGPTGGCVSLPKRDLAALLRWLDPADSPRIAMGVGIAAPPLGSTGPTGASGLTGQTGTSGPTGTSGSA
jgi:L,D-peptidoglycan transpeptidase YkuD (ErfK/YbiS/YcfS/YnhG family)